MAACRSKNSKSTAQPVRIEGSHPATVQPLNPSVESVLGKQQGRRNISGPPNVGELKNGRASSIVRTVSTRRMVYIRYVWSDITPKSAALEQSCPTDGGKTWEVNWITDQTQSAKKPQTRRALKLPRPQSRRHPYVTIGNPTRRSSDWKRASERKGSSRGSALRDQESSIDLSRYALSK